MARETTVQPGTAHGTSDRLVGPDLAREALERYPWPLITRVAGYIAIGAALTSTLFTVGVRDVRPFLATFILGLLFSGAFYLLCHQCQMRMRLPTQFALVLMQVACAVIILRLSSHSYDMGPLILLFVLAVELQFLAPFHVALLGTGVVWVVAVVAVLLCSPGPWATGDVVSLAATTLAGFVFVAAFTRSAVTEVIQRHQADLLLDELNAAHAQLQRYVHDVEELAVARERNRMAREIHDTLGHYLTVINVQLETAQKVAVRDPARGQEALAAAKRLASECLGEVRRSVAALRPAVLDEAPLPDAVGRFVEELRRSTDLTIHVESHGTGALPPAVETTVYRVIQEAMTNVRKHAQAHNVWLLTEWGPGEFLATIRDDGRGAPASLQNGQQVPASLQNGQQAVGFGLQGMRERVAAVGGTLETTTAPGAGFCVTVRLPLTSPAGPTGVAVGAHCSDVDRVPVR